MAADEVEVAAIREAPLLMTNGTEDPMLMNTGEIDVLAATMENITEGHRPLVATDSKVEEGGGEGVVRTMTIVMDGPLLIIVPINSPYLRRHHILLTLLRPSL